MARPKPPLMPVWRASVLLPPSRKVTRHELVVVGRVEFGFCSSISPDQISCCVTVSVLERGVVLELLRVQRAGIAGSDQVAQHGHGGDVLGEVEQNRTGRLPPC